MTRATALVASLIAVTLITLAASPAYARKYHRYLQANAYQTQSHDERYPVREAARETRPTKAKRTTTVKGSGSFGYSSLVARARGYVGTNPTGWSSLWCGRFMAMIAPQAAARIHNPNMAREWANAGRRISGPQVGAIAVMTRGKTGGHVGVVTGVDADGDPIIISGNAGGNRVQEFAYPRSRVYAYVMP